MTFADSDCGIVEPHRHTGELVEGYHIEYWCPTLTAWVTDRSKTSYGLKCTCEGPHMKARIQHTMTEIIEIIPQPWPDQEPDEDFMTWLKRTLKEHYFYLLFNGEEAYNEWVRKYDTDSSMEHGSVRDGRVDTPKSGIEGVTKSDGGGPPEG